MLRSRIYIALEFIFLCIAFPTYIWMSNSGNAMFGFLWAATFYCFLLMLRLRDIDWKKEIGLSAVNWGNMRPVLIRWFIATILILAFTFFYEPDRFLYIPLEAPGIIPFLILAYPVLSALPQEFIFCSFFMRRYGPFIKRWSKPHTDENAVERKAFGFDEWMKIIASAIVFGYAHMLFLNWVAPVFSFMGGLIFAHTYLKTRSLALVTLEHSLYGNSIFLAGIGYYFYSGGIGQ